MGDRCVFLDRDRTVIEDPGYLTEPDAVKLLPGVGLALKSLRQAGFKLVVVTNQSAIARGLLTEEGLDRVHQEMRRQLGDHGVQLDAIYYCPYHPEGTVELYAHDSQDRKPRPGMLLRAASEHNIDLPRSWMIGDSPRDMEAGQRAGCRTIRVRHAAGTEAAVEQDEDVQADFTVRNLVDAARVILRESGEGAITAAGESAAPVGVVSQPAAKPPPEAKITEEMSDGQVLREILRLLRQMARAPAGTDFSALRLVAAIFQLLAFVALAWGLLNIPAAGTNYPSYVSWHLAMVTAGALQLIALTFFILSRQR
jgi:D-glycero-D-manno-heptose 1,7-bisphosphate phosphatase